MIKKTTKIIAATAVGFCAFVVGMINFSDFHDQHIRHKVGSQVVMIVNIDETSGGTGWYLKTKSGTPVIITNRHVCGLAVNGKVKVKEEGGRLFSERMVLKVSDSHDLCAISAPDYRYGQGLSLASDVAVGDTIYLVGHPNLRPLVMTKGELIDMDTKSGVFDHMITPGEPDNCFYGKVIERQMELLGIPVTIRDCVNFDRSFWMNVISFGGSSGSPVTNKWGNVIGVLFAGNNNVVNDSMAVKLKDLREFVEGF